MRCCNVVPGLSFGPFHLGCSILKIADFLQRESAVYGNVQVLMLDVLEVCSFNLKDWGIELFFEANSQLLQKIVVYDLPSCNDIWYSGRLLSSAEVPPTIAKVYSVIGPTFQGSLDLKGDYTLSYPGLHVHCHIPPQYSSLYTGPSTGPPTTLPDGTAPIVRSFTVDAPRTSFPPACVLQLTPQGVEFDANRIPFGATPQDVMGVLGPPSNITDGTDDRLFIHHPHHAMNNSYFYNYPEQGLDVCFHSVDHVVSKVLCYNPTPLDGYFLRYRRCRFQVNLSICSKGTLTVTNHTKFTEVQSFLQEVPKPLLTTSLHSPSILRIYAIGGIVFYVMADDCICRLLIRRHATPATLFVGAHCLSDTSCVVESKEPSTEQLQSKPCGGDDTNGDAEVVTPEPVKKGPTNANTRSKKKR